MNPLAILLVHQAFVFRTDAELQQFYDLADNSRLCRFPYSKAVSDLQPDEAIVGLWN
jgi:hypothetical protein